MSDVIIPPMNINKETDKNGILFDDLFLIQEYFGQDLKSLIEKKDMIKMSEEHVKTIIYNILCAV